MQRRVVRSLLRHVPGPCAAALCAVLTGLPPASADARDRESEAPIIERSETGSYLAARHARSHRDYPAAADFLRDALRKAPAEPAILEPALDALVLDGRIDEAIDVARRLIDSDMESETADLVLAVSALAAGDAEAAKKHLDALPKTAINQVLEPLLTMWALYGAGRTDEARAALAVFRDQDALATITNLHGALLEEAEGETDAAVLHYEAALAAQKDANPRLIDLVGQFYERVGRREDAITLYREYLDSERRSAIVSDALDRALGQRPPPPPIGSAAEGASEALFWIAAAASRRNDPEAALMLARLGLSLRPDFPVLQVLTAQLLESLGRLEEANGVYNQLQANSPLAWEVRLNVAANLDRLDRFDEARALLRTLARERPDDPDPLIALADMLRARERFREAVDVYDAAFERIPEIEPRHWRLLYARGIALERSKMWERAEADFLKALEFEPDQPFVLNYLGYSWIEKGRHLDRALEMIESAVEQRPRDGYIVDSLGWAHYKLGNYADAVRELERAVLLRPQDPVINDHLGDAYWKVGRQREARFQWTAALHLDPEPELRAAVEKKLEQGLVEETAEAAGE